MLLIGLHGKALLVLHQVVQHVLAGGGLRAGVADVVEGPNLAHLQDRSWGLGVTADSLAHSWPASRGHPPGPDIIPLHASCSSDWSSTD